mgnify:FL=1
MSQENHGHKWPSFQEAFLEEKMGELVSSALRGAYAGESSPVKKISQRTGIAPDSIKRWYTSKKAPSLEHFLILMRTYPAIFEMFLKASGHGYLIAYIRPLEEENVEDMDDPSVSEDVISDVPINVIDVPINFLNERQGWFLILLQHMNEGRAEHIAGEFGVSLKTARRDIEKLKEAGKIRFVGAKKTGRYEIIEG